MNYLNGFINGVLFGSGMIFAAFAMNAMFHIGFCH